MKGLRMSGAKGKADVHWSSFNEGGHRFPLVHRGLDFETQTKIERAMEELAQVTTARISEAPSRGEA